MEIAGIWLDRIKPLAFAQKHKRQLEKLRQDRGMCLGLTLRLVGWVPFELTLRAMFFYERPASSWHNRKFAWR